MELKEDQETPGSDSGPDDHGVGYRKPPKATRFPPGQSGNPRGRPIGSRGRKPQIADLDRLRQIIRAEGNRTIPLRDGDQVEDVPIIAAIMRRLNVDAVKGQARAQRLALDLFAEAEAKERELRQQMFEAAVNYKMSCETQLAQYRARGLPEPELVPDPDHLVIDPWGGTVILDGPFTEDEKRLWQTLHKVRDLLAKMLRKDELELERSPDDPEILSRIADSLALQAKNEKKISAFKRILVALG